MSNHSAIDRIRVKDQFDFLEVTSSSAEPDNIEIDVLYPRRILKIKDYTVYDSVNEREIVIEYGELSVDYDLKFKINGSKVTANFEAKDARIIELLELIFGIEVSEDLVIRSVLEDLNSGRLSHLDDKEFTIEVTYKEEYSCTLS